MIQPMTKKAAAPTTVIPVNGDSSKQINPSRYINAAMRAPFSRLTNKWSMSLLLSQNLIHHHCGFQPPPHFFPKFRRRNDFDMFSVRENFLDDFTVLRIRH